MPHAAGGRQNVRLRGQSARFASDSVVNVFISLGNWRDWPFQSTDENVCLQVSP